MSPTNAKPLKLTHKTIRVDQTQARTTDIEQKVNLEGYLKYVVLMVHLATFNIFIY